MTTTVAQNNIFNIVCEAYITYWCKYDRMFFFIFCKGIIKKPFSTVNVDVSKYATLQNVQSTSEIKNFMIASAVKTKDLKFIHYCIINNGQMSFVVLLKYVRHFLSKWKE